MVKKLKILKDMPPIQIKYISCNMPESDTETEIYNTNKLTVLLTDGLLAVLGGNVIGGKKGDILVFTPEEVHFGRFLRSGEHRFIEFYFPKEFFNSFYIESDEISALFTKNTNRINCIRTESEQGLKIIQLAEKAAYIIKHNDNDFELLSVILQILIFAGKHYTNSNNIILEMPTQVQKALEFISKNFSEKIALDDIANLCGCSIAYLSRQFKKYMGVTVYGYILYYRLNYSTSLLQAGYSVAQAASLSGFEDCSNYINAFKKEFGTTPYKYKSKL